MCLCLGVPLVGCFGAPLNRSLFGGPLVGVSLFGVPLVGCFGANLGAIFWGISGWGDLCLGYPWADLCLGDPWGDLCLAHPWLGRSWFGAPLGRSLWGPKDLARSLFRLSLGYGKRFPSKRLCLGVSLFSWLDKNGTPAKKRDP